MTSIYRQKRFELYVQLMDKIKVQNSFKEMVIEKMIAVLNTNPQKRM